MKALSIWIGLQVLTPARLLGQHSSPEATVRSFIRAQEAAMQEGATTASIDSVTRWLTDSVVYEHPRAGARLVGRATVTHAMADFLGATRHARIAIRRLFGSAGVIVVEEDVRFEQMRDGAWVPGGRTQVSIFDFEGDQISRIVDFWRPR